MKCEVSLEDYFYGTATVGERGQVVIPAEARKKFNISAGDKVLVIGHPAGTGVMLCKINGLRELFTTVMNDLEYLATKVEQTESESGAH